MVQPRLLLEILHRVLGEDAAGDIFDVLSAFGTLARGDLCKERAGSPNYSDMNPSFQSKEPKEPKTGTARTEIRTDAHPR